jgi:hypothetical protein
MSGICGNCGCETEDIYGICAECGTDGMEMAEMDEDAEWNRIENAN